MLDLPPESRIQSKLENNDTVLTIPKPPRKSQGCIRGSWSVAAVFGFLAVTFAAQGIFTKNSGWLFAAVPCLLITAWQLLLLRGLPGNFGEIQIRIGPEYLSRVARQGEFEQRRDWPRSVIADICLEPADKSLELRLHMKDGSDPICLLTRMDPKELEWIAEQIRLKWKMGPSPGQS